MDRTAAGRRAPRAPIPVLEVNASQPEAGALHLHSLFEAALGAFPVETALLDAAVKVRRKPVLRRIR